MPLTTPFTSHVTAVFVEPVTVARKDSVLFTTTVALVGVSDKETPEPPPPLLPLCPVLPGPLQPASTAAIVPIANNISLRSITHPTQFDFRLARTSKARGSWHHFRYQCIACSSGQLHEGLPNRWYYQCSGCLHDMAKTVGLIHVAPVGPGGNFHHQRHGQFVHAFHFFSY